MSQTGFGLAVLVLVLVSHKKQDLCLPLYMILEITGIGQNYIFNLLQIGNVFEITT